MKRKMILVLVAAMLLTTSVFSMTGCKKLTKDQPAGQKGVLRIGVDDEYPPMEYRDENNNLVGFDVDMAQALAEKMEKTIEWTTIGFDGIFMGLESKKYDLIISSVSMTPERLEKYAMTKPYLANGQVIVVKPGDESVKTPEDLAGLKVGVQSATTADTAAKKQQEKTNFTLTPYDDVISAFMAMESGRVDCIVVDYAVALEYSMNAPDKYAISSTQLTNEPITICLRKEDTALLEEIENALDAIKADGTLSEISIKWLKDDYTQDIDTNLW